MRIGVLVGTRPGIIKMAPIVHELRRRGIDHRVFHTGQHFSPGMDEVIMADVCLPSPDFRITRPSDAVSHAQQTAYMLVGLESALVESGVDVFLVCGDANTNLAGALAARKLDLTVGHVESGLRSEDWRMPEEHNRVMIDHISELLFAPTETAKQNLLADGVRGQAFVVGNTVVDSALTTIRNLDASFDRTKRPVGDRPRVLATFHRQENVDDSVALAALVSALDKVLTEQPVQVVFPIHPRTMGRLKSFGLYDRLTRLDGLTLSEPLGYKAFLQLLASATCVVTDSGGIQEEACILGVPCVTARPSTERPETVSVGANEVAGTEPASISAAVERALAKPRGGWGVPYGDGEAARRIVEVLESGSTTEWNGRL